MKRIAYLLLLSTVLGFSVGPSPVLAMDENDIEKCNRYYKSKTHFKETPITEVTCLFPKGRRQLIKGFVPGDGDCSLHTLKVLFPHKDINRQTFFDTLFHAYRTGNPDLQENIRTELLNEVFMELFNPLLDRTQRPGGSSPVLVELATQMEAQVGDIIRTFVKPNWQRDGLSREEEVLCQFTRYRAAETPIGLNYGELRNIHTRIYAQIGWAINSTNCPSPYNQQALEGLAEVVWGQVNHPLHEDTVDKYLTLVRNRLREDDDQFLQILPYMASNDIFLTSVGDDAHTDGRGTLDLACRLFKLNVVLFFGTRDGTYKVRSTYRYGGPSVPEKFMLLTNGHYSPLAAQDDYATQQEMVNKFVALMRLRQGIFKTFDPFTDLDREFPTQSEGVARHMRWPVFDPASGLWQDYRHPESVTHPAAASAFSSAPPPASYSPPPRGYGASAYDYGSSSGYVATSLPHGASNWSDVTKPSDISLSHLQTSSGLIDVDTCVALFIHARGSLSAEKAITQLQARIREILMYAPQNAEELLNIALPHALKIFESPTTSQAPIAASFAPPPSSYGASAYDYGSSSGYVASSYFGTEDLPREPSYLPIEETNERVKVIMLSLQLEIDDGNSPAIVLKNALRLNQANPIYHQAVSNMLPMLTRPFEQEPKREIESLLSSLPSPVTSLISPEAEEILLKEVMSQSSVLTKYSQVRATNGASDEELVAYFIGERWSALSLNLKQRIVDEVVSKYQRRDLKVEDISKTFQAVRVSGNGASAEALTAYLIGQDIWDKLTPQNRAWAIKEIAETAERRALEDFLRTQPDQHMHFQENRPSPESGLSSEQVVKYLLESYGYTQWEILTPETKQWVIRKFETSL